MIYCPLGGDSQIVGRVAVGKTKMVIFLKYPLSGNPQELDVNMPI